MSHTAISFCVPLPTSPPKSCSLPFFYELRGVSSEQVLKPELFGQHSTHCPQHWQSRKNLPEILITVPASGGQEPAAVVSRATNIVEKGHKKSLEALDPAFKSQGVEGRARDCCEQRWLFSSDCSKCQLRIRAAPSRPGSSPA